MHNKVYFTETKPGVFEKNSKFKLKTNFVANTKYKEAFGWRVRDRINDAIEQMTKIKYTQNLSNKEKTALRNLIRTKTPKSLLTIQTKIWGPQTRTKEMSFRNA